jgi:phage gp36-like protein
MAASDYITLDDLDDLIPADWVTQALTDNDGDTVDQAFAKALTGAQDTINGLLSNRYTVPIANGATMPFLVSLTRYLTLRGLYAKRGYSADQFPHNDVLKLLLGRLDKISTHEMELDQAKGSNQTETRPTGALISGEMRTRNLRGAKLTA